jgi:hypothetical protein
MGHGALSDIEIIKTKKAGCAGWRSPSVLVETLFLGGDAAID